jgi:hypothetical protein
MLRYLPATSLETFAFSNYLLKTFIFSRIFYVFAFEAILIPNPSDSFAQTISNAGFFNGPA